MLHPTSRPLPRPDPSSWYSVFPIMDSQQILFELMNSPRISQHFSQISELWDDLVSGREMSREARLFFTEFPTSSIWGRDCGRAGETVPGPLPNGDFRGPHKSLMGMGCFSLLVAKRACRERESSTQKKLLLC